MKLKMKLHRHLGLFIVFFSVISVINLWFDYRFDDFKKFAELQNKYEKLLEENRHIQLQLVDAISENGHNIAQLTAAQEEIEKFHDVVENVRQFLQLVLLIHLYNSAWESLF